MPVSFVHGGDRRIMSERDVAVLGVARQARPGVSLKREARRGCAGQGRRGQVGPSPLRFGIGSARQAMRVLFLRGAASLVHAGQDWRRAAMRACCGKAGNAGAGNAGVCLEREAMRVV
jgi:hypothetical protein